MKFRVSASVSIKHNISKDYLRAAISFAEEAQAFEEKIKEPDTAQMSKYRGYVTAAILLSVTFMEASINELYLSAIDPDSGALPIFNLKHFHLFKQFWEIVEKFPILQKYQIALLLGEKDPLNQGIQPYQDADNLIRLRDLLVHYKPEWDNELGQHQKLENRLRDKFNLCPYARANSLWFPNKCLGTGCAKWSVDAAQALSNEFCSRLGIRKRTI